MPVRVRTATVAAVSMCITAHFAFLRHTIDRTRYSSIPVELFIAKNASNRDRQVLSDSHVFTRDTSIYMG